MALEIRRATPDELTETFLPITVAFGLDMSPERIRIAHTIHELDTRFGAFDGGSIAGAVSSYSFSMTVPGGAALPTAGTTLVGVLPTHRRRGILRALMRAYLDDAHARARPLAALFASEAGIYGRFGYGLASFTGAVELPGAATAFAHPGHIEGEGRARFVSESEARELFPPIWERVRPHTPGMLSRSPSWWDVRRLGDREWQRAGRGPLQRVLIEIDGHPAAYALYRSTLSFPHDGPVVNVDVSEAIGDSPRATRAVWRYLLELDLLGTLKASLLPVDHPLLFLLADPRRLRMTVGDGLWLRLVDVGAALSARSYEPGEAVSFAVEDRFCPWNDGTWTLDEGRARRTHEVADLALGVDALGAVYLGGVSFEQLVLAGRARELRAGAAFRADRLFRRGRAPWCPDMF
jgi:predicted acetyltransferase